MTHSRYGALCFYLMKKQSKQSISLIQRKIWKEVRRIVLDRYPHECYTCGAKNLTGSNRQVGHMWSKATLSAYLKYDLRVLRLQCYRCNINCGGRGADFYARMLKEYGQEFMDNLEKEKQITVKAYDFYIDLLAKYVDM